ncbi:MAG: methionine aminotransferase [Patescibacteria group bacterium]|jgi:methionine aminotransferase
MQINSKLPNVGTTIFSVMSALANEHQAINLSQGFPNFDCPEGLKERVNFHMQNGKNQYVPMAGVPLLRERLAQKMEGMYGQPLDAATNITITAGATQALFTAIAAFIRPGDEVILIEPAYDSYRPSIEVVGGVPVVYELTFPDYRINWDDFQQCISEKTKMIIINTPHNPIGKVLSEDDLLTLQKITNGTDIIVLSDEVYEHLIFDGKAHQSVLRFPELFKRSLIVYSFGKTFHSTGWKMGYCVAPELLMKEFRKVHQFNVFSVNSFVQYGIADFLSNESFYLDLPNFYQQKRDFFQEAMAGSRLRALGSEGTYFQLFDYSAISEEADLAFAKRMTTEFGVAAIPVSAFYSSGRDEKVIRLCFAKTEEVLKEAGEILGGL